MTSTNNSLLDPEEPPQNWRAVPPDEIQALGLTAVVEDFVSCLHRDALRGNINDTVEDILADSCRALGQDARGAAAARKNWQMKQASNKEAEQMAMYREACRALEAEHANRGD